MDSTNILMQKGERLTFFLKHPIKFSVIKLKKKHMLNNFETKDIKKIKKTSKSTLSKHPSSGFKPGDIVKIRSRDDIKNTLDENDKLEGCLFMKDMWRYCGTKQKVLKKIDYFYDEANFKMCKAHNVVLLDGLYCSGIIEGSKQICDRYCLVFWKEDWLEKI